MYERFTDRARKVMQLANEAVRFYNHEYVAPEHILMGLVKEGSGIAANVLKSLDVDLRKVQQELEKLVQPGMKESRIPRGLSHSPNSKEIIEHALEEARNLSHNYVGTEHLLLSLLRTREGLVAQVFANLGLQLDQVRQATLDLLGQDLDQGPRNAVSSEPPIMYRLGHVVRQIGLKVRAWFRFHRWVAVAR